MRLMGISGKMGTGKTTLAKEIIRLIPEYKRVSFADVLKVEVSTRYGIPLDWCYSADGKNEVVTVEDDILSGSMPVRRVLQDYGNARRKVEPLYWVDALFDTIGDGTNCIIDDVRFPNEAVEVVASLGLLIRLEPYEGYMPGNCCEDISETALDCSSLFDYRFQPGYGGVSTLARYIVEHLPLERR